MDRGPDVPSRKPKAGGMTLSTNESTRILKSHGLNVTKVTKFFGSYGQGMSQR